MFIADFLKILAVATLCVASVKGEDDMKPCPFLLACIKETNGKVKLEDLKAFMTAKVEDLDGLSEDLYCVSKCAMEKRQIVVDEKINVDKLTSDKMMMHKIENQDEFIECVKKIEGIKECGDVKEFMKCKITFSKNK